MPRVLLHPSQKHALQQSREKFGRTATFDWMNELNITNGIGAIPEADWLQK